MTVCVRGPRIVVVVTPPAVVVVVAPMQLVAPQLSQQLVAVPTHATPPIGVTHFVALDFTEHFVVPFALRWQHVTPPDVPHVDFLAHLTTADRQDLGRLPSLIAAFTAFATQWT
jgi:hypothetical protein